MTTHRRVFAVALATSLLVSFPCSAADLTGQATVIDGDTIEIHGTRIRLYGIDAPESAQTCEAAGKVYRCGQQAAFALVNFISGRLVRCGQRDIDRYGRIVAVCYAGAINLGAAMVANGWALAYRKYLLDYVDEEQDAQTAKRGMWRGMFVAPWDWRKGVR